MKRVFLLSIPIACASILAVSLASAITPIHVHSLHHEPETLDTLVRQSSCDSKADCADEESCLTLQGICQTSACDGVCLKVIRCSCSNPCEGESSCILIGDSDGLFLRTCILNLWIDAVGDSAPKPIPCDEASDDLQDTNGPAEPSSSEEEEGDSESGVVSDDSGGDPVCIGVHLLEDFASHQLVFEKHAFAWVLCDSSSSCATKGHMVNFKGKVMMMGTYCDIVGCERKVMKVNSPKYERGLRVTSRSADMHFTAFAARYGTNAEEAVLAAVVRIGL